MSVNNTYANVYSNLARGITNAAMINNSKYGGTGISFIDTLRPFLDFIGGAYGAYAANPDAEMTAVPGIVSAVQGLATRKYLRDYQTQLEREYQAQQNWLNRQAADRVALYGQFFPGYSGATEVPEAALTAKRESLANPYYSGLLHGENLPLDPNAKYEPQILQNALNRFGDANNFAVRNLGGGAIQEGQGLSLTTPGTTLDKYRNSLAKTLSRLIPGFDTSEVSPRGPLQAGVGMTGKGQTVDWNSSPYGFPTDIPNQYANLLGKGLDDAQTFNSQLITQQDNLAKQDAAQRELDAKIKGGYFINYPPVGPAPQQPTEATRAYEAWKSGVLSDEQYARTLGAIGQEQKMVDPQLEYLADYAAAVTKAFGKDSREAKQAFEDYSKYLTSRNNARQLGGPLSLPAGFGFPPLSSRQPQTSGKAAVGDLKKNWQEYLNSRNNARQSGNAQQPSNALKKSWQEYLNSRNSARQLGGLLSLPPEFGFPPIGLGQLQASGKPVNIIQKNLQQAKKAAIGDLKNSWENYLNSRINIQRVDGPLPAPVRRDRENHSEDYWKNHWNNFWISRHGYYREAPPKRRNDR